MPRNYTPKPGGKRYRKHDPALMERAVKAVKDDMPYRNAEKKFKIPQTVIRRHKKMGKNIKKHGGQTVLNTERNPC